MKNGRAATRQARSSSTEMVDATKAMNLIRTSTTHEAYRGFSNRGTGESGPPWQRPHLIRPPNSMSYGGISAESLPGHPTQRPKNWFEITLFRHSKKIKFIRIILFY